MTKQLIVYTTVMTCLVSCGDAEKNTQDDLDSADVSDTVEDDSDANNTAIEAWDNVCDTLTQEKPSYALPASQTQAPQLVLVPSDGESYTLTKEASADGWFVLEVGSWMCDVEIYTPEGMYIELGASDDWLLGEVGTPVMECGDTGVILHSWTFHAWGSYVVHIQAENETTFWLATRLVER